MTSHTNILAWEIQGQEEPGGLQPMGSQYCSGSGETGWL